MLWKACEGWGSYPFKHIASYYSAPIIPQKTAIDGARQAYTLIIFELFSPGPEKWPYMRVEGSWQQ